MNDMSKKLDLKKIRRALEAERDSLLETLKPDEAEDGRSRNPGRGELATEYANMDRNIALRGVEERTLEQVEAALARLEDGTYGICSDCGKSINPERMEALPHATLCIECQAKAAK
jgi:DnaK suppressor protein